MRRLFLGIALAVLVLAGLASYAGVSYEIAAGVTKAERHPWDDTLAAHGLVYQDITFPSRDVGVSLSGWNIRSVDTQGA